MINDKSLIKYKHDNEQGLMHYVVFEGEVGQAVYRGCCVGACR